MTEYYSAPFGTTNQGLAQFPGGPQAEMVNYVNGRPVARHADGMTYTDPLTGQTVRRGTNGTSGGGGGGSLFDQLLQDYKSKYQTARDANTARYEEGKGIYQSMVNSVSGGYGPPKGSPEFAQWVNGTLDMSKYNGPLVHHDGKFMEQYKKDLGQQRTFDTNAFRQNLIRSGLGRTTISANEGASRQYQQGLSRFKDAQQQAEFTAKQGLAGWIERRTDDYPDQRQLQDLAMKYGATGGGGGGGAGFAAPIINGSQVGGGFGGYAMPMFGGGYSGPTRQESARAAASRAVLRARNTPLPRERTVPMSAFDSKFSSAIGGVVAPAISGAYRSAGDLVGRWW